MPDCKSCKEKVKDVSYIVHEGAMARMERTVKRLWITIILLIALLVGSNGAWLWYESQFEDVTTTESYEAITDDGGNAIASGNGDITINGNG